MKKGMLSVIGRQLVKVPPATTADLSGKTVLVVGGNAGIGFEATKHFAKMNPGRLILACRSQARGDAAAAKIKEEIGVAPEVMLVDLSSFASVKAFADALEKSGARLDILVTNAALLPNSYDLTEDGWEASLQVNTLSTPLICLRLALILVETGKNYGTQPRIVIVSSQAHYWVEFSEEVYAAPSSFKSLNSQEHCKPEMILDQTRYNETKLLNVFFTRALAEAMKNTPVIVNTVCPGYCYSELRKTLVGIHAVIDRIQEKVLARTAEEGSRELLFAALGQLESAADELRGAYLESNAIVEPSDHVIGEDGKKRQDKLWKDLISELTEVDARIPQIVKGLQS